MFLLNGIYAVTKVSQIVYDYMKSIFIMEEWLIFNISPVAAEKIKDMIAKNENPEQIVLRVKVDGFD